MPVPLVLSSHWNKVLVSNPLLQHIIPKYDSASGYSKELGVYSIIENIPVPIIRDAIHTRNDSKCIKKGNSRALGGIRKKRDLGLMEPRKPKVNGTPRPFTYSKHARNSVQKISTVLNMRTNASPFTLILDDLNQPAAPIVREYILRGFSRNLSVVLVSFHRTFGHSAMHSIPAYGPITGTEILSEIKRLMDNFHESLVIIDSLYGLLVNKSVDIKNLFKLVAIDYNSHLVGVYHTDLLMNQDPKNAYAPDPLSQVKFSATTIMTCKSLTQVIAAKRARERAIAESIHGILQEAEGVVQSLTAASPEGIVLEVEFRRRSGTSQHETYYLRAARKSDYLPPLPGSVVGTLKSEFIVMLSEVPEYEPVQPRRGVYGGDTNEILEATFKLELTEKQKEARDSVVLPYYDAQDGKGEGGRILYEMGTEDDFDEEEDEI
ncbi:hypothetical protein CC78DRAFT_566067 [Lojkania enalia]|uniref:Elongator complex protein 5 n=1 Tax=Lojkania enalia TaxID=147567 RepID=A0A9P4KF83_9PLEO|nr:hypothetical protein CC78DRAFT_566067 [Didymosphaeria enalia]